ncbi:hypothetical protein MMC34_008525 [Xylographa carneopallida]|nr:hypothetical protein [Xylographa carneopallida]
MQLDKALVVSLFVGLVAARPSHSLKHQHKHQKRVLTPDNTCGATAAGNNKGYVCDPNDSWGGPCCSQHGYCGNTSDYCGLGCQDAFGTCDDPWIPFAPVATTLSTQALITFSSANVASSSSTTVPSASISSTASSSTFASSSSTASSAQLTTTSTSTPTSSFTLISSTIAPDATTAVSPGISSVSISPEPVQSGCLWVVAGSGSFTHTQTFDFTQIKDFPTADLAISNHGIEAGTAPHSQMYNSDQVSIYEGTLQLKVPGGQTASPIYGAEVQTSVQDILYGSVRTTIQVSEVPGTCHGLFYYKSDNQESDIEILTADLASGIHYTNQATVPGEKSTTTTHPLPSNATAVMHEYRLDWLPGKTVYYLDGVEQQVLVSNVPDVPGSWLWNNWSNGDPEWSAGPPGSDNILKIGRIEMYYNRTGSAGTC